MKQSKTNAHTNLNTYNSEATDNIAGRQDEDKLSGMSEISDVDQLNDFWILS